MTFITWFWILWFLVVASIVVLGLGILGAIGWCLIMAWAWFKAWRAERQLLTEMKGRRGWRAIKRAGYTSEDLH